MKNLAYIFILATTLVFCGCANLQKHAPANKDGSLKSSSIQRFSDIPVPAGFNLIPAQSYSFENSGMRVGMLKYEGKAKQEQLINFYKDSMQEAGWNFLNILEYDMKMLNFEKENETCVVVISPKMLICVVTISLGPKSHPYPRKNKEDIIIK